MEVHVPVSPPESRGQSVPGAFSEASSGLAGTPDFKQVLISTVSGELRSYKDLPKVFFGFTVSQDDGFQSGFQFPKEREYFATEACSFDRSREMAQGSADRMEVAFQGIFSRVGLDVRRVAAERGGFDLVFPFWEGLSRVGSCSACGYSARQEFFPLSVSTTPNQTRAQLERIHTPGMRTAEEVVRYLGCPIDRLVKTMIYNVGGEAIAVLLRGDHTVSERKLADIFGRPVQLASAEVIEEVTKAPLGFAGPVGLEGVRIIADYSVRSVGPAVTGANEADYHFAGVLLDRDYRVHQWADLRSAQDGDCCGKCGAGTVSLWSGVELARTQLERGAVSDRLGAWYTDEAGESHPLVVGYYVLALSRLFGVLAERYADDRGLVWPVSVAPFEVHVLNLAPHLPDVHRAAEEVVDRLERDGWEVLHDERMERPGVKFHDADLLGLPYHVVVGAKSLQEGFVEVGRRNRRDREKVSVNGAVSRLTAWKQEDVS
jgi:prolyl-tRNA synthetase